MLAPSEFAAHDVAGYLDTATYGLPPRSTVAALEQSVSDWQRRAHWMRWEEDGEACRALFGQLVGADPRTIALVPAVSVAAGLVAMSLPTSPGDNIVLYERDFSSTLLPWVGLEQRGVELRLRPLGTLPEAVDERTTLVVVSTVQSADGAVADLDALKATGVRLFVDATQALGAVPTNVTGIDYLAAHSYKWLLCPRGLGFLYVRPERLLEIEPWLAGWKSSERPYEDFYGIPRDLTSDARRLDTSLPWFLASGSRRSLELVAQLGASRIGEHNRALVAQFTAELGVPDSGSAIVSVAADDVAQALEELGRAEIRCSARAGSIRFSFHLYNSEEDVARALEALSSVRVFAAEA